ncbi:MAG: NarK family nitrate/nitrite MFS transporter [Candidatus Eisenbacteria bacterium]|nr:NarK family nitrate/nitrite MFS transporter [Candidatus Eisenbacteria bacterium]
MTTHRIKDWRPEDPTFWSETGERIANRNLWISIPALLLAFSVWMVWSVIVVKLRAIGFHFTEQQEFWLAALPALTGATMRILYSFMVPIFGGRNWTVLSTASLLVPAVGIGLAVQNPATSYETFVLLALLCGFGGANFASSMANINPFFPAARKGMGLGLNAGLGNLGVSFMQFLVPIAIAMPLFSAIGGAPQQVVVSGQTRSLWLQNAGWVWVPMILVVTVVAWFGMNNLDTARASFRHQAIIFRRKHNWIMCWLYLGTFGSFIGYSAAFPRLIKSIFDGVDPLQFAFLGPLVGALARPVGGWMSDRWGGARVTFWNFLAMMGAAGGVIHFVNTREFGGFLVLFLLLFMTAGVGNASTFKMIPVIFLNQSLGRAQRAGTSVEAARRAGTLEASAILGFSSAIGAYGGFIIPIAFGNAIKSGTPQSALAWFLAFYASCLGLTWWFYYRRRAEAPC